MEKTELRELSFNGLSLACVDNTNKGSQKVLPKDVTEADSEADRSRLKLSSLPVSSFKDAQGRALSCTKGRDQCGQHPCPACKFFNRFGIYRH